MKPTQGLSDPRPSGQAECDYSRYSRFQLETLAASLRADLNDAENETIAMRAENMRIRDALVDSCEEIESLLVKRELGAVDLGAARQTLEAARFALKGHERSPKGTP